MKHYSKTLIPPRLSMDEYADFVENSMRESDPVRAARQKELEEQIQMPFRIAGATLSSRQKANFNRRHYGSSKME